MSLVSTVGTDGSGNRVMVLRGKFTRADGTAPIVVYCHGHMENGLSGGDPINVGQYKTLTALAEAGYVVVSGDFGGNAWGNPTAHTAIDDAIAWAQNSFAGRVGKVLMAGTSMGGCTALSFTGRYPSKVAGCMAFLPVTNLADKRASFPTIDTAYGGTYTDSAFGLNHSPIVQASAGKFAFTPLRIWYGDSDLIATPASIQAMVTAINSNASPKTQATALSGGHSELTTVAIPTKTLIDWATARLPINV